MPHSVILFLTFFESVNLSFVIKHTLRNSLNHDSNHSMIIINTIFLNSLKYIILEVRLNTV